AGIPRPWARVARGGGPRTSLHNPVRAPVGAPMSGATPGGKRPFVPPRGFVVGAWAIHRAMVRWTGGRRGIWAAKPDKWGTMRLHTVGRKSGAERIAILGYQPDGDNLVTVAMNGWGEGDPKGWLNLKANPHAAVELRGVPR